MHMLFLIYRVVSGELRRMLLRCVLAEGKA